MMNESQLIETVQSLEDYRATADALTDLCFKLGTILEQLAEDVAQVNEKDNLREVVSKVINFLDKKESSELELIKH